MAGHDLGSLAANNKWPPNKPRRLSSMAFNPSQPTSPGPLHSPISAARHVLIPIWPARGRPSPDVSRAGAAALSHVSRAGPPPVLLAAGPPPRAACRRPPPVSRLRAGAAACLAHAGRRLFHAGPPVSVTCGAAPVPRRGSCCPVSRTGPPPVSPGGPCPPSPMWGRCLHLHVAGLSNPSRWSHRGTQLHSFGYSGLLASRLLI